MGETTSNGTLNTVFLNRAEFIDEHGRYPAGTWVRSPHMSKHNPYVEQDTVILVKVGHL